jgi:hypothetical protein
MAPQPSVRPWPLFSFSLDVELASRRTAETQNKSTQTSMPQEGFEPTIPVFERTKIVPALDRAAM